jgi:hypothetical protein
MYDFFLFKEFLSFFTRLVPWGIIQSNCCLLILDGHGSRKDDTKCATNIRKERRIVVVI